MGNKKIQEDKISATIAFYYKIAGLVMVIIIAIFIISDLLSIKPIIKEYNAPQIESIAGLTNQELKNQLLDEISGIFQTAESLKGTAPGIEKAIGSFNIEISGIKSNYGAFLSYLKYKFGIENKDFSISVVRDSLKYCYRIRLNDLLIGKNCISMESIKSMAIIDTLLQCQAKDFLYYFDPYILSMYYFKSKDYKMSLELANHAIKTQPKSRIYALGTIANSYKELKEYDKAIENYEKSKKEYPRFYPTIWQYSDLNLRIGEYSKAEELALEVLASDVKMKKEALITLLKIYSRTKNKGNFSRISKQIIEIY